MSKYNYELDIDSENSLSNILKNIAPNTKVLEFGCAHGRMTKYMKETLNCNICIVESDLDSGTEADAYSYKSYLGAMGDIETEVWYCDLKESQEYFDYIVFADVLEHLYNPWEMLKKSAELLNTSGSIFISVPNIAHNSVIIDLWNNQFNYRPLGILDSTHIRFFTYNSLLDMVMKSGLTIVNEINTRCAVEHTEFENSIDDIPEEVSKWLQKRDYADVYQFVWELKKQ